MRKYWLYLLIIVQLVIVVSLGRSIVATMASSKRLDALVVRKEFFNSKKEELVKKISELDSEYYVERVAREQLHLVKEGEVILMLPDEVGMGDAVSEQGDVGDTPNYLKWLAILHLVSD